MTMTCPLTARRFHSGQHVEMGEAVPRLWVGILWERCIPSWAFYGNFALSLFS